MICRLLPHEVRNGPENMALDEALLDSVDADPRAAVLRTYGWSEPTLSLGYFQSYEQARAEPRWSDVPLIRRPSGGGALWHDREITYALIVPRTHPVTAKASDLYRAVHAAIATALRSHGIAAVRRGEKVSGPPESDPGAPRPFLCFLDRDPEDLLLGDHKIVGSAQRRRSAAVLQHGSFLLRKSERTPELPGAADLLSETWSESEISTILRHELCRALGLAGEVDGLTDRERGEADHLAYSVYRDPGWTRIRRRSRT